MITRVPFYHGTTRNLVIAFCGLFSGIFIRNKDANDVTKKIVAVPIAFVNKEKFMVRLMQDPGLNEDANILLPRMSAEIVGIDFDASRQLNKTHRVIGSTPDRTVYSYTPVPYNLTFNLYTYTRTTEDNLQIMEQIVPFFRPDMNLAIKMLVEPPLSQDVPLILNNITTDDQYDGSFEDRRTIISTYSFIMKAYYYGPILNSIDPENHFESGPLAGVIKNVDVTVNNTNKYNAVVDPFAANEDDVYQIFEGWTILPPQLGQTNL